MYMWKHQCVYVCAYVFVRTPRPAHFRSLTLLQAQQSIVKRLLVLMPPTTTTPRPSSLCRDAAALAEKLAKKAAAKEG
jgi:hypothetical protein